MLIDKSYKNNSTVQDKVENILEFITKFNAKKNQHNFLKIITQHLSELFDFNTVIISKYIPNKTDIVETVFIYSNKKFEPNITYELKHTPCENVFGNRLCVYTKDVQNTFPKDEILVEMGIESYVGLPLWNSNGIPIGIITMLDNQVIENSREIETILNLVGIKVSQELENQFYENELKLKIQDLTEVKEKYRSIVENSPNWIWEVNTKGDFIFSNFQFEELLGTKLINLNIFNLIPTIEQKHLLPEFLKCSKEKKGWKDLEIKWIDRKGCVYYFESSAVPIIGNNGILKGFRGINRDVTERKKMEKELLDAKMLAENNDRLKTKFLHNMSHEIRTPMNGILGFSKMLEEPNLTEEKRQQYVNIIQNSGEQLLCVIDDILEISKLETKQVKVAESKINLNQVLFELFSIFNIKAKKQNLKLSFNCDLNDEESHIYSDKNKLVKILGNLLENSLKFTQEGSISFGYIIKKENTSKIEFYVKDSGLGIEKNKQEMIFERFSQAEKNITRNAGGLGLGLSIAKENSELLGGCISVDSELTKGATFYVTIPYKPVTITPTIDIEKIENKPFAPHYTILIAEDEDVNYLFLEILILEKLKLNCTIFHAKNGKIAVDICKKTPKIDLILMDVKMPVLNGYDASKQIKELYPSIPIIAQTAYSTREDKNAALAAGCVDHISKPIKLDTLKDLFLKYLKKEKNQIS